MSAEGWAAVPNWIIRDGSIPPMSKVVLLVISSHIGREGSWFMGHATIAEEAGVSVSSVKRALADLRERGLVSWTERHRDGERLENLYTVTMSVPTDLGGSGLTDLGVGSVRPGGGVTQSEQKNTPKNTPKNTLSGASASKRGTRLPDDFTVTPEMVTWARETTPLVGATATAEFKDYWSSVPGSRGVKLDWVATWRNWMRKAQQIAEDQRDRRRPAGGSPAHVPAATATAMKNTVTDDQLAAHERWLRGEDPQ